MAFKRREFVKGISLAGIESLLRGIDKTQETKDPEEKRVLRIAHITDVHLSADNNAPERFIACLRDIERHQVDFFLNGGDSIMAADYDHISRSQVTAIWVLWKNSLRSFQEVEMYSSWETTICGGCPQQERSDVRQEICNKSFKYALILL